MTLGYDEADTARDHGIFGSRLQIGGGLSRCRHARLFRRFERQRRTPADA